MADDFIWYCYVFLLILSYCSQPVQPSVRFVRWANSARARVSPLDPAGAEFAISVMDLGMMNVGALYYIISYYIMLCYVMFKNILLSYIILYKFFPTCQVRVVRFYQSCSPYSSSSSASCPPPPPRPPPPPLVSPRPCLHQLPPPLPPCQLFAKLFANSLRRLSAPSSLPTSQLSVHRWTSTWDLPSSVCTAGPQPGTCPAQCAPLDLNRGTCPAQCAPLDLNLGPAQLSVHRWTSTAR